MDSQRPPFELGEELGAGRGARVYLARLLEPLGGLAADTQVAVKVLNPEHAGDPDVLSALEIEYRVGSTVRSDGLVRHLARGRSGPGPWIVMAYVPGRSLREVLEEEGPLPEPLLRSVARDLAGALGALHAAGYQHGDIKPENARLDDEGRAVLVDLGFARRVGGGGPLRGTLLYLAPEQAAGRAGAEPSDVFSLGVVLYELATARHPFVPDARLEPERALAAIRQAQTDPPSRHAPFLSPFLDALLAEMLEREPGARPSAAELRQRLAEQEAGTWWRARLERSQSEPAALELAGVLAPMAGRQAELTRLEQLWAVTRSGRGSHLWLLGEAGMGKTRLVQEFAARARAQAEPPLYLSGRCGDFEEQRPCQAVLTLLQKTFSLAHGARPGARERRTLESLLPPVEAETLLAALDPQFEGGTGAAVPQALVSWLVALAHERPTLVFLDDVDRADEGTLDVLGSLAERLGELRLLLLLGRRLDAPVRRPEALARLEGRLPAGPDRRLQLEPLDREAVLALVLSLFHPSTPRLRLARALHERSRGSPGLVVELLRALAERGQTPPHPDGRGRLLRVAPEELPLPGSVRSAIRESIGRLPAADRSWLARLAVLGEPLEPDVLRRMVPGRGGAEVRAALARLARAGWLVPSGDHFRFAAPAQREALMRALRPADRERLHAAAAQALRPRDGAHPGLADSFRRAYHLREAGRYGELLVELTPLLRRLLERGHPQRVHTLTRWGIEALAALPASPEHRRTMLELLEAAADAADRLGLREDQRRALDRLLEGDYAEDPESAGRVYLLHARYAIGVGQYGPARGMLMHAVELFEETGSEALLSDALRRWSAVHAHLGELDEARRLARRARGVAPDELLRAQAETALGVVDLLDDRIELALRRAERAALGARHAQGPTALATRARALLLRARAYRCAGRPRRALASAQQALRLARLAGERRAEVEALARLGGHWLDVDRPTEAETHLREALHLAGEIEDRRGEALASLFLGILLGEAGDREATAFLERALERGRALGMTRLEALGLAVWARVQREQGRAQPALEATTRALAILERHGAELMDRAVIVGTHALLLDELGRGREARELVRALRRRMRRETERFSSELVRRRHRLASTRLLEAVLSPQGPVYPRIRLQLDPL